MPRIGESTGKPQGWGAVARRKAEIEERREAAKTEVRDFWVAKGKSAIIQLLQAEPFVFDSHVVDDKRGYTHTVGCQCMTKKRCTLCSDGIQQKWAAGWKLLDYRGKWDKEADKFLYDEKIEKVWSMGITMATKLQLFSERKGKNLNEVVLEVTYLGKGDFSIETALDDDDKRIIPIKYEEKLPSAEDIFQPPTDDEIDERGYKAAVYKK